VPPPVCICSVCFHFDAANKKDFFRMTKFILIQVWAEAPIARNNNLSKKANFDLPWHLCQGLK
jgi:hypothetical protein